MWLIRFLLVITVALSTSPSGAMDASHAATVKHDLAAMEELVDDQPICGLETTGETQTCHALLALLPGTGLYEAAPATSEDVIMGSGLLMTGIKPSGPIDPLSGVMRPATLWTWYIPCNHTRAGFSRAYSCREEKT